MFSTEYFLTEDLLHLEQNIPNKSHPLLKHQVKSNVNQLLNILKRYHYETFQHSINVARLSLLISCELGISQLEIITSTISSLLHDIGKIKVASDLLSKPANLTAIEWDLIKKHPQFSAQIISSYSWGDKISHIVLCHHERIDGNGYYGFKGKSIPLGSRIVSISDAFDAMMSHRPYQNARSWSQSCEEIQKHSGSQFDSDLVQAFVGIISKHKFYL